MSAPSKPHVSEHHQRACEYILTLLRTFPTFSRYMIGEDATNWDVDRFMLRYGTASSGERHVMRFIATVWNPSYAKDQDRTFDAIDACTTMDSRHRAAFINWVANPNLP